MRRATLICWIILLAFSPAGNGPASAQPTVSVQRGAAVATVDVPINRGIVIDVSEPFVELSIANPNIADIATLSERSAYILGRGAGRTSLTVIGEGGRLISNIEVRVTPDIAEFKERLAEILPREAIEVRTANDGIVLSGRVSGAQTLARAIELAEMYAPDRVTNMMSVSGMQQVMLKVRFAEMERSVTKGLGARLGIDVGDTPGRGFRSVPSIPGVPGDALGQIGIGFMAGDVAVNLMLEALESRGLVRTLAEPNLVAVSGEEARFLAGGEYPVPVANDGDTITVEYRPFGVELNFRPTVVQGDLINLNLRTTVSAIDPSIRQISSGIEVDGFRVRRAETTIEMRDGQSFAIAGLLEDDFNGNMSKFPWISEVPIIGALFRSSSFRRRQSELVIIVTPHLVAPTTGAALGLSGQRVTLPSEAQFFLRGQLEAPRVGATTTGGFSGAHGYVFD